MPIVEAEVSCPVRDSFRVRQVAGMFDAPIAERATFRVRAETPSLDEPWEIGLVVGPSASGKSTLARAAFGDAVYRPADWPRDVAVIDALGDAPIKQTVALLAAVGLNSPPAWIKPHHALSNGEQFRCDLARALAHAAREALGPGSQSSGERRSIDVARAANHASLEPAADSPKPRSPLPLVVFDEFTSVVDRNAARMGAAAVARAIRGGRVRRRFVAVTCHYDVAEWLEPDWIVDLAAGRLERRRLRRPSIELDLVRTRHSEWSRFAPHHYLSGQLSRSARCFAALWRGEPVAFCATIPSIGRRAHWRITRLVVLPDFQGVGIGSRVAEGVAGLHRAEGHRVNITAGHPAIVAHCARSPRWRLVRVRKQSGRAVAFVRNYRGSIGRATASFEYHGDRVGEVDR